MYVNVKMKVEVDMETTEFKTADQGSLCPLPPDNDEPQASTSSRHHPNLSPTQTEPMDIITNGSQSPEPESSTTNPELDFLIAKYLVSNPRYRNTGQALVRELEENQVIPPSTNWIGQQVPQNFNSFDSKISHHIGPQYLSHLLTKLLTLSQNVESGRSVPGPISHASSSLLSITTSSLVYNNDRLNFKPPLAPAQHPIAHRTTGRGSLNISHSLRLRELYATNLSARPISPQLFISNRFLLAKRSLGHLTSVYCVLFDQSGKFLVTAADDKLVKIWSLIDGRLILTLRGNSSEITDLAINLENTLLATSTCDKIVRVWSLSTGELLKNLVGHTGNVTSVFFCPMSRRSWTGAGARVPIKYLASTGNDGNVCFWAYKEQQFGGRQKVIFESKPTEFQERMRPGTCQMICSGFSSGGIFFAAGNADCNVRVYYMLNPDGPKRILENQTHSDRVDSISWAHRGIRFVSGSRDGLALVWRLDPKAGGWRYTKIDVKWPDDSSNSTSTTHRSRVSLRVTMVGWSCDDRFVFTAIAAGSNSQHRGNLGSFVSVKVWCPNKGSLLHKLNSHTDDVYVVEPHPVNPRILCTAGHDGKIVIWDVGDEEQELLQTDPTPIYEYKNLLAEETGQGYASVFDAKWSPDGLSLGATDSHGNLLIFTTYGYLAQPKFSNLTDPSAAVRIQVPDQLFFHTDYRPLSTDQVTGEIVDEQTQVLPHLMPPPFLVNSDGSPYPTQLQRLVPGRENCRDEQLIPNVADRPDGVMEVLDQRIAELVAQADGQILPPAPGPVPDPGVRHTRGNWQREATATAARNFVKPLSPSAFKILDSTRWEYGQVEELTYQEFVAAAGSTNQQTTVREEDNSGVGGTEQQQPAYHSRRLRQLAAAAAEKRRIQEERRRNEEQGVPLPNPPQLEISSPQFHGRNRANQIVLSNGRGNSRRRLRFGNFRGPPPPDDEPIEEEDDERDPSFSESGNGESSDSSDESEGDSVWGLGRGRVVNGEESSPQQHQNPSTGRRHTLRRQNSSDSTNGRAVAPVRLDPSRRRRRQPLSPEVEERPVRNRRRPRPNVIQSDHEEEEEPNQQNGTDNEPMEDEEEEQEEPTPSATSESDWSDQQHPNSRPQVDDGPSSRRKKKRKSLRASARPNKQCEENQEPGAGGAGADDGSDEDYQDPRVAGPSSRLTRSKANPEIHGNKRGKSRPKRSQPRKNLDEDLMDPIQSPPSEWLASTEPKRFPYYPQLGDDLVYFRQGHENYVSKVRSMNLYPTDKKFMKQLPFKANPNLPAQVPCRVTQITYLNKPPVVVMLKLVATDWESGSVLHSPIYNVTYHDVPEVVDFLILRQYYDKSMRVRWNCGDRFRCLIDNTWWLGNILEVGPEGSEFLRYKIQWDDKRIEALSPWDLDVVPDNFVPPSADTLLGIEARTEEIREGLYEVSPSDWAPYGHIDIECDRILSQLSIVMGLGAAEPFLTPVDLNAYPDYLETVLCPVDLSLIKTRLESRFYRRSDSLKFDIKQLNHNTETYNQPGSEIVKKSKILRDLLLGIVSGDVGDVVREFHAIQESFESNGSGDQQQQKSSSRRLLKELNGPTTIEPSPSTSRNTRAQVKKLGPGVRLGSGGEESEESPPTQSTSSSRRSSHRRSSQDDNESSRPWEERCLDLLLRLHGHPDSAPFRAPVDPTEYPDYHVQIDTPMDLQTIREEFLVGGYQNPNQFVKDMGLVFSNSKQYNTDKHSQIYKMTLRLKNMFEHQIAPILTDWRKRKSRRGHSNSSSKRPSENRTPSKRGAAAATNRSSSSRRALRTRTTPTSSSQQSTPRKNPLRHAAARNPYVHNNEDEDDEDEPDPSEDEESNLGGRPSDSEEVSEEEEDSEPVADGDEYRDHRRKRRGGAGRGRRSSSTNTITPPPPVPTGRPKRNRQRLSSGTRTTPEHNSSHSPGALSRTRTGGTNNSQRRRGSDSPGPQATTYSAYGRPVKRLRIVSDDDESEDDEDEPRTNPSRNNKRSRR